MKKVAVVMAGGSGERFWPVSTASEPKQLLRLTPSGKTLLEEAMERISPVTGEDAVFVSTSRFLEPRLVESGLVPASRILAEPAKRNTLGAVLWSAAQIEREFGSEVSLAFTTADHLIGPQAEFCEDVEKALDLAIESGSITIIGIPPTRAETGYGYLEIAKSEAAQISRHGGKNHSPSLVGHDVGGGAGDESLVRARIALRVSKKRKAASQPAPPPPADWKVLKFKEKPDFETAEKYVKAGNYLWNSGMFIMTLTALRETLHTVDPDLYILYKLMVEGQDSFEDLPSIAFDRAVLEKAADIRFVPATFQWDDIGSWDSLLRTFPEGANAVVGRLNQIESEGNVIYSTDPDIRVNLLGVTGLGVIVTDGEVVVIDLARSQEVRDLAQKALEGS